MQSHEGGACLLAGLPAYLGLSHFGSAQTSACLWPVAEADAEHRMESMPRLRALAAQIMGEEAPAERNRMRVCKFCVTPILHSSFASHKRCCRQFLQMNAKVKGGYGVQSVLLGGVSQKTVRALLKAVNEGKKVWPSDCRCRKGHCGELRPWGWCHRNKAMYKASSAIAAPVAKLLESLRGEIKDYAAELVSTHSNPESFSGIAAWFDEGMHLKTCVEPGMTNAYFGLNYVPVDKSLRQNHAPPGPVAEHLGVSSCSTTCSVCQAYGCSSCPGCCLHYDVRDHGPTLLLQHQKVEAPADEKAYFVLGDRCIEMSGGFCALFDGASILHGAWSMKPPEDTPSQWTGVAFVCRS